MVIELLGPSLEDLFNVCGRKFSLKTTIILITQLLDRFEYFHKRSYIHWDLKPDNLLMGLKGKSSSMVYLIDFGLSKRYFDLRWNVHIPYRKDKHLMGTARFASIHSHMGEELSRRDDLEALSYIMLYFINGSLPWQSIPCNSKADKYCKIRNMKQNMNSKELCVNTPPEFRLFVSHCRALKFEEEPKYEYLRGLLAQVA